MLSFGSISIRGEMEKMFVVLLLVIIGPIALASSYPNNQFYKGYSPQSSSDRHTDVYCFLSFSHELVRVLPRTNEHLQLIRYFEDHYGVSAVENAEAKVISCVQVDRWSEVLQINREVKMSLPRKQRAKIKKLCKLHGIDLQSLNQDLEE